MPLSRITTIYVGTGYSHFTAHVLGKMMNPKIPLDALPERDASSDKFHFKPGFPTKKKMLNTLVCYSLKSKPMFYKENFFTLKDVQILLTGCFVICEVKCKR